MTGNNKVWRAPLAGLASVAMLATMGVAASTANAADVADPDTSKQVTVTFDGTKTPFTSVKAYVGETIADAIGGYANIPSVGALGTNKVFGGWTIDGKTPVSFTQKITGNTTLKPLQLSKYYGLDGHTAAVVKIEFSVADAYLPFAAGDDVYALQGEKLSVGLLPVDKAGDGKVYTNYDIDGEKTSLKDYTFTDKNGAQNPDVNVFTVKGGDQKDVQIAKFKADASLKDWGYPVGDKADGTTDGVVEFDVDDASNTAAPSWFTVPQKGSAKTKTVTSWKKAGKPDSDGNVTYVPGGVSAVYKVTFQGDGVTSSTQNVNAGGFATLPADPTREGFTFAGWRTTDTAFNTELRTYLVEQGYIKDSDPDDELLVTTENDAITNVAINTNLTFDAVWYNKTTGIKITFKDASYKGHQASVSKTVAGGAFLDESLAPAWTRDGYYLAGWKLKDGKAIDAKGETVELVDGYFPLDWQVGDDTSDLVLEAVWKQVTADVAKAALNYVNGSANPGLFTDASWTEYAAAYKKIQNEYDTATYNAPVSGISKATATKIVSELKAAWEKLVFVHTTNADVEGNFTVHRLSKGGEHFYTADSTELKVLTSKLTTRGGWTDEGRLFQQIGVKNGKTTFNPTKLASFKNAAYIAVQADYDSNGEWTPTDAQEQKASDIADQLADAATPIVKQVYRLYNKSNGDHVWTIDETEYNALAAKASWNDEGIAFYVPAFTGTTTVTRLYKGSRHLLSTDSNEQKVLSKKYGWKVEGTVFKAY
ncbi:InlB B-repeat-containing protein [Bifidobacterium sp. 82T10]|uniref:InlB B-repeat-containing protein n=1 Tax=Bifidobacterium miconis TaxID=2834435 RepID=A0ABS6WI36_9BIFI|nr:InlB B-repeat-containing protein [Bifidobacterium miconis]MBW3093706.1 InlB B-repeat-containing protein [Bifidobacterium miconis]